MTALKNIRHENAIQAFLSNGGNKSAAYREAFESAKKYKKNTVWTRANELFKRSEVIVRIKELQDEIDKENIYKLERILEGFGKIAFSNITDIIDYDAVSGKITLAGGAKKLSDLPREATDCIASIKQTKAGFEIKMYSKDQALVQIAKMMGYYAPEKVMQVTTTFADLLKPC